MSMFKLIAACLIAARLSFAASWRHTSRKLVLDEARKITLAKLSKVSEEQSLSRHDCGICLDEVYERTVDNCTKADEVTLEALACQHFLNYHNDCFIQTVVAAAEEPKVECSMCRQSIILTATIRSILEKERKRIADEKMINIQKSTGISLEQINEKWPDIIQIGGDLLQCGRIHMVTLMQCAFHIWANPSEEDVVSPIMDEFHADRDLYFTELLKEDLPEIGYLRHFPVYIDDFGSIITLGQAFRSAYDFRSGHRIYQKLNRIEHLLDAVSHENIAEAFLAFPDLEKFKFEFLYMNGVRVRTIYHAVRLLCISSSSIHVELVRARLSEINQGFLDTKHQVDEYLKTHYPYAEEFKNVGTFKPKMEHITPRYLASLAINPSLENPAIIDNARNKLDQLNAGMRSIPKNINTIIMQNYGHCHQVLQEFMQNVPGQDVTLYQALKYVSNKNLFIDYRINWNRAITFHLTDRGCTRNIQSPTSSLRLALPPPSTIQNNIGLFLHNAQI